MPNTKPRPQRREPAPSLAEQYGGFHTAELFSGSLIDFGTSLDNARAYVRACRERGRVAQDPITGANGKVIVHSSRA